MKNEKRIIGRQKTPGFPSEMEVKLMGYKNEPFYSPLDKVTNVLRKKNDPNKKEPF